MSNSELPSRPEREYWEQFGVEAIDSSRGRGMTCGLSSERAASPRRPPRFSRRPSTPTPFARPALQRHRREADARRSSAPGLVCAPSYTLGYKSSADSRLDTDAFSLAQRSPLFTCARRTRALQRRWPALDARQRRGMTTQEGLHASSVCHTPRLVPPAHASSYTLGSPCMRRTRALRRRWPASALSLRTACNEGGAASSVRPACRLIPPGVFIRSAHHHPRSHHPKRVDANHRLDFDAFSVAQRAPAFIYTRRARHAALLDARQRRGPDTPST
ncbi:hypothetical protein B0H17DRAFT_1339315 [Mycena rosella]|uniref:Uncharacterized protein n=1 Tax=Mycena rosella TaxID=1033263 RepID=A0AAD7C6L6_MYCRO|nr:hypothetical protein B0H17DRAFT_1339315 [Mycena rosella]